jgi:FimV-like protein
VVEAELEDLSRDFNDPLDQAPAMTTGAAEPAEPVASTPEALDDDFDFFADTDETHHQLDLARAYIDMGDAEEPAIFWDEVMSEGSDNQQQEAREMLAKLAWTMIEAVLPAAADTAAADVFRIALGVEYKGARYRGFQRQRDGVPSIQLSLENALSKVAGGHPVTLSCAGRTDALVHACARSCISIRQ